MTRNSKILYTNFVALFVLNHANEIFVLKGHDLKLNCPDTPVNSWQNVESFETIVTCENGLTQVNKNLSFSSKIFVTKECNIEIKNFTGKEVHQIQCFTSEESYKFNITLGGLTVDEANEFGIIRGVEGKYVSLTCRFNGHFAEQNIFFLKGSEIMAHSPSKVLPMKFVASKADHQQFYVCFVNNTTDGKQFNKSLQLLLVLTPNVTIHTSPDTTVMEGEQLELFCKDESGGIQDHTEFKWTHNNARLWENHHRIIIAHSNRSDAGQYTCTAENDAGNDTDVVKVTVQFAPVVQNNTLTFYSVANTRLLVCDAYAIPKVQKFGKWKHFSSSDQFIRFLNGFNNGTLSLPTDDIIDSKYEDSGIYECRASNNIIGKNGDYWQTGRIKVIIRAKPVLAKPFSTEFYGYVNNISVMTVIVLSSTTIANTNWLNKQTNNTVTVGCSSDTVKADFYDTPVDVAVYRCMLKIQNTTESDLSVYFVSITNQVGSSAFEICLKSPSTPDTPEIISLQSVTNHIILTWKPLCNGGYNQEFVIQYKKQLDTSWKEMLLQDTNSNTSQTTLIKELKPNTVYEIQMFAISKIGKSNLSKKYTEKTKGILMEGEKTTTSTGYIVVGCLLTIIVLLLSIWHIQKARRKDSNQERVPTEQQHSQIGYAVDNDLYQSSNDLIRQQNVVVENLADNSIQIPIHNQEFQGNNAIIEDDNSYLNDPAESLEYIEVVFDSNTSSRPFYIHGADNKTPYADINFSARVEPVDSDSDNSREDNTLDDDDDDDNDDEVNETCFLHQAKI